mmetsp:Transcript_7498/g.18081  ORF Transcript_7498/g.18081 Transcript_7498/m.18081 type:complete len:220 (-) Transcript_7498:175-834(-)
MPPVFGPSSLSNARLWSWARGKTFTVLPSEIASTDSSLPPSIFSTTTSAAAAPKSPFFIMPVRASFASSSDFGTIAPFPAASPLAFTTTGQCSSMYFRPASYPSSSIRSKPSPTTHSGVRRKIAYSAVGISHLRMKSFENAFDSSRITAALLGPKTMTPSATKASVIPSTSGCSGPTTTSETFFSRQNARSSAKRSAFETRTPGTLLTFRPPPPFPGNT